MPARRFDITDKQKKAAAAKARKAGRGGAKTVAQELGVSETTVRYWMRLF